MKKFNFGTSPSGSLYGTGKEATTAAMLSVIPGLGQFYNGQSVKGFLFMDVAVVNAILLTIVLFAEPMAKSVRLLLLDNHVKPNEGILQALSSAHLGTPFSLVFISSILLFVGFAIRDAYDYARERKLKPIYADSALHLSEAASGSYLFHFVAMFACAIFTLCFLIPRPAREQVVEISFVPPQARDVEPLKAKKFSDVSSSAKHKDVQVKRPTPANSAASQAHAAQQSHQAQTRPLQSHQAQTQPRQSTPAKPTAARQPVHAEPAPAPPAVKPVPSAARALLPRQDAPAPIPLKAPSMVTPAASSSTVPAPIAKPLGAASTPAPAPLLAFAPAINHGPGPVPLAINHSSGASNFAPMPAEAKRSNSSSSLGYAAPAPVSASSTSGSSNNVTPAPISGAHSHGTAPSASGQSISPTKIASALPPGGGIMAHPVTGSPGPAVGTSSAPRLDSRGLNTESGAGKGAENVHHSPDFGAYMSELQRRIKRNWGPPKDKDTRQVVVEFTIFRSGELGSVHVSKSSGMSPNDQAAIAAIRASAPFMPLPKYSDDSVDIQFTFDYHVFNGRASY